MINLINNQRVSAWDDILSLFPENWKDLAEQHQVMKGVRQDKSLEQTMHTLMIHLICGLSLKETTIRARLAGLYNSSHIALRDRLIKFGPFFMDLCNEFFTKQHNVSLFSEIQLRLIDATDVKEPGPTGSLWRYHFSFTLPDMTCDFTKLTPTKGKGVGESFMHFPVAKGDLLIADRGYCKANGISYVQQNGGYVCVRFNYNSLPIYSIDGKPFRIIKKLEELKISGQTMEWDCSIRAPDSGNLIEGRICAIRKSEEQIKIAHKKCDLNATKYQSKMRKETYFINEFIIIFTTFDRIKFPLLTILTIYRWRWQVELVFKRFKSLLQLGHLPTKTEESSKAWLYGKLFAALLIEHTIRYLNGSFSPWRCYASEIIQGEPVDYVRIYGKLNQELDYAEFEPARNN